MGVSQEIAVVQVANRLKMAYAAMSTTLEVLKCHDQRREIDVLYGVLDSINVSAGELEAMTFSED